MSEVGSVNLLKTNDLHLSPGNRCGTNIAKSNQVKNMSMFDRNPINCTKNVLDYLSVRQKIVASNVANVNTPGYKSRDVAFSDVLKAKSDDLSLRLTRTNSKHFMRGSAGDLSQVDTYLTYSPANPLDGVNDVDLDKEMVKEGEVQVNFKVFSDMLSRKYKGIGKAIRGTV